METQILSPHGSHHLKWDTLGQRSLGYILLVCQNRVEAKPEVDKNYKYIICFGPSGFKYCKIDLNPKEIKCTLIAFLSFHKSMLLKPNLPKIERDQQCPPLIDVLYAD